MICGRGGIGRRAGLGTSDESRGVQVPPPAPLVLAGL